MLGCSALFGYNSGMDSAAQLTAFDLPPELVQQVQRWVAQAADVTRLEAELKLSKIKIEALVHEIAVLKRLRFGASSEARAADMKDLFDETLAADLAACEARLEALRETPPEAPPASPRRPRAGRPALPAHLERIEHRHEPESCTCGQCGQDLVKIGEDVSEQLDIIPAKFFVHRHIRPQYACRRCETVSAAPVPAAIIDGGMAAPRLLAWVTVSKFVDHLPLYRIEQIAARSEVPLPRSTQAEWVGRIGVALAPLCDRLIERLREGNVLHADETPVEQLDPGRGKTKRAYLWAYRSNTLDADPPIVIFDYQPGRGGQYPQAFLKGWKGMLMVDDYGGYKALFGGDIGELACLAHARRKYFELHQANKSPVAAEALARIGELYALEEQARDVSVKVRAELRLQYAQPRLEAMYLWLVQTRKTVADGAALARAIDYSLKRWPALARYASRGDWPIDNNPIENAIRPIALGKKNWMFAGSEAAGKRAAVVQSLLATARANGFEPLTWLADTLEKLPTWPNSRIDELLPIRKQAAAQA
ncbi:Mobile element protein [Thauera aromatica K172]|uniref:Mobile element protein n=2 Tax=Thauera aromatica TaxID=59405 RepID=A0A2R4BIZ0_THAAR|nr:Mobile element protein [Thauera aromatica K172]AVR87272.1 Mobile element protein [Thauera aromatica K172]AVR89559.1 Mobile element protein [Thauera aromatica K172]